MRASFPAYGIALAEISSKEPLTGRPGVATLGPKYGACGPPACLTNVSHPEILILTGNQPWMGWWPGTGGPVWAMSGFASRTRTPNCRSGAWEPSAANEFIPTLGSPGPRPVDPELDKMLDRLGPDSLHLLEHLDDFRAGGNKFRSLCDGIVTDSGSELGGAMEACEHLLARRGRNPMAVLDPWTGGWPFSFPGGAPSPQRRCTWPVS